MPMIYFFVYIPFYTKKSFLKVLILIKSSQIPPTILTIIKKKSINSHKNHHTNPKTKIIIMRINIFCSH